jgi:hypothetical protein
MDEKCKFIELWVMESYIKREWHKRYTVNISAAIGRGPHTSPLAFYNTNTIVMGGYISYIILFNFKTERISMMQLWNGVFH